jgi:hypothetical protein
MEDPAKPERREGCVVQLQGLKSVVFASDGSLDVSCDQLVVDGSTDLAAETEVGNLPPNGDPQEPPVRRTAGSEPH